MTSSDPGPDYEIIGVSLHGPHPLGWLHLKWDEALTVLYGPNGAGKTTILAGIRHALTGTESETGEAYLHVRLRDAAFPMEFPLRTNGTFSADIVAAVEDWIAQEPFDRYQYDFVDTVEFVDYWTEPIPFADPVDVIQAAMTVHYKDYQEDEWEALEGMDAEVLEHRTFTLWATGIEGLEWEVLPSVPFGADSVFVSFLNEKYEGMGWEQTPDGLRWTYQSTDQRPAPMKHDFHGLLLLLSSPESWVPIPVAMLGTLSSYVGPDVIDLSSRSANPPVGIPHNRFKQHLAVVDTVGGGSLIEVSPDLAVAARQLGEEATRIVERLVPSFPALELRLDHPADWPAGDFAHWEAMDRPSGTSVPLSALSEAQRRWSSFAIRAAAALAANRSYHTVLLVDEPEHALHPQAAADVAKGLANLASTASFTAIVASHSPASEMWEKQRLRIPLPT